MMVVWHHGNVLVSIRDLEKLFYTEPGSVVMYCRP